MFQWNTFLRAGGTLLEQDVFQAEHITIIDTTPLLHITTTTSADYFSTCSFGMHVALRAVSYLSIFRRPKTMFNRRLLLQLGLAACGGAVVGAHASAKGRAPAEAAKQLDLPDELLKLPTAEPLIRDSFAHHVNTTFQVHDEAAGIVEVELVKVTPARMQLGSNAMPHGRYECFSLFFCGPKDQALDQGTYQFEHHQLGALDLFIVPTGPDEQGQLYQAAFSRWVG
jgi:hypothetical protein